MILAGDGRRKTGAVKRQEVNQKLSYLGECIALKNSYFDHLKLIDDWAVFGSLDWQDNSFTFDTAYSEWKRQEDFKWLMWVLCARHDIKQRRLAICHKSEFGESKRGHIHFLIAQQSIPLTPSQLAASLTNIWRLKGKGFADIVPFDSTRHLRGIDYQSKVESDESGHPLFSNDVFSPALQRRFRANAGLIQLV